MIGNIIFDIIFIMILSGIFGILIAIVSKIFYVQENTIIEEIYERLPKYNCGACGKPGCKELAKEIIVDIDSINKCKPIKKEQKDELIKFIQEKQKEKIE